MKSKIILSFCFSIIAFNLFSQKGPLVTFGNKDAIVYDICFSKFGSWLVFPEHNIIYVYDVKSKQLLYKLENGHTKDILSVDISPDSSMIVSGGKDSLIMVWDIKNTKILSKLKLHQGVVTSIKFSPDQKYLASGSSDKSMIVYDLNSNSIIYKCTNHTDDITSVAFSNDNKLLACSSGDNTISIVNTETWNLITTLKDHKNWVRDIKFSPDNSKLYSCGDDSRIISWNISDLNNIQKADDLHQGSKWLLGIDINPVSKTYVSCGMDGRIKLNVLSSYYKYNIRKTIQKVLFKPNEGIYFSLALATRGKGVILLNAKDMNSNSEFILRRINSKNTKEESVNNYSIAEINEILKKEPLDTGTYYKNIINKLHNCNGIKKIKLFKSPMAIGLTMSHNLDGGADENNGYKVGYWVYYESTGEIIKEVIYDVFEKEIYKKKH